MPNLIPSLFFFCPFFRDLRYHDGRSPLLPDVRLFVYILQYNPIYDCFFYFLLLSTSRGQSHRSLLERLLYCRSSFRVTSLLLYVLVRSLVERSVSFVVHTSEGPPSYQKFKFLVVPPVAPICPTCSSSLRTSIELPGPYASRV